MGRCFFLCRKYRILSVCETPEPFHALENVTGASVDKMASSKWVESQSGVNYSLKPEWRNVHPTPSCSLARSYITVPGKVLPPKNLSSLSGLLLLLLLHYHVAPLLSHPTALSSPVPLPLPPSLPVGRAGVKCRRITLRRISKGEKK